MFSPAKTVYNYVILPYAAYRAAQGWDAFLTKLVKATMKTRKPAGKL